MNLSEHFTLAELFHSNKAESLGIDNAPPDVVINNLRRLAALLEEVRTIIGKPMTISSGYRSPALNKAVGGAETSQHRLGCAADFVVAGISVKDVMKLLVNNPSVHYDQLIQEGFNTEWIHISVPNSIAVAPRRQALVADKRGVRPCV